jgi:hypothetical protein
LLDALALSTHLTKAAEDSAVALVQSNQSRLVSELNSFLDLMKSQLEESPPNMVMPNVDWIVGEDTRRLKGKAGPGYCASQ